MELIRREAIKLGATVGVLGGVSGFLMTADTPQTKAEGAVSLTSVLRCYTGGPGLSLTSSVQNSPFFNTKLENRPNACDSLFFNTKT